LTATSSNDQDKRTFKLTGKDIGQIKNASLLYKDKAKNSHLEMKSFKVNDSEGFSYLFETGKGIRSDRERTVKAKLLSYDPPETTKNNSEDNKKSKLFIQINGQSVSTKLFQLLNPNDDGNFKKNESNIGSYLYGINLKYDGDDKVDSFCRIKSIRIQSNKGHDFKYNKAITIKHNETININERSKANEQNDDDNNNNNNNKKPGKVMIQIIGDKKSTDLFQLKESTSDDDQIDLFTKVDNDLGMIKNVLVQYHDDEKMKLDMKYIEIIDERGNTFKYVIDMTLDGGDEIMLPRKSSTNRDNNNNNNNNNNDNKQEEKTKIKPKENNSSPKNTTTTNNNNSNKNKKEVDYKIEVKTGSDAAAGTNANVFISIFGDDTSSNLDSLPLNKGDHKDLFENAQLDTFIIKQKDIGKVI
jgi:hypothetical protein